MSDTLAGYIEFQNKAVEAMAETMYFEERLYIAGVTMGMGWLLEHMINGTSLPNPKDIYSKLLEELSKR